MTSNLPYRPNVGACIINPQGLVFAAERSDIAGAWQMPQGGIDEGEEPGLAVLRELEEETGITEHDVTLLGEHPEWLTYDFPTTGQIENFGGKRKFRGQRQKWFLLRYTGTDAAIDIQAASHNEFVNWQWVTQQWFLTHVVPFRQPIYTAVFAHFADHLS